MAVPARAVVVAMRLCVCMVVVMPVGMTMVVAVVGLPGVVVAGVVVAGLAVAVGVVFARHAGTIRAVPAGDYYIGAAWHRGPRLPGGDRYLPARALPASTADQTRSRLRPRIFFRSSSA